RQRKTSRKNAIGTERTQQTARALEPLLTVFQRPMHGPMKAFGDRAQPFASAIEDFHRTTGFETCDHLRATPLAFDERPGSRLLPTTAKSIEPLNGIAQNPVARAAQRAAAHRGEQH